MKDIIELARLVAAKAETVASSRFTQTRVEPGVENFLIHRSRSEPAKFFFYEVFKNEAAFAAHQQTAHFKNLIAGEALEKLAKRECAQYSILLE